MTHVLALVLAGIAAGVVWTVRAWFWPLGPCRRCKGSKKSFGSGARRFGQCRRCKGSGIRQVLGAGPVQRARAARRKGKQ